MEEADATAGQPAGFATPDAPPLGAYSPGRAVTVEPPVAAPAMFAAPGDPGPNLASVAPAPAAWRDPRQPFEAGQEDQLSGARDRDPREPFVTDTINGKPDFAPPTGQPVGGAARHWTAPNGPPAGWGAPVAAQPWGGGNVGAIARPGEPRGYPAAQYPGGPHAYPAQYPPGRAYPAEAYPGVPAPNRGQYAPAHPGAQPRRSAGVEQYRNAHGVARVAAVFQAVPWPILLVLLGGVLLPQMSVICLVIAWVISNSSATAARQTQARAFMVAAVVYVVVFLSYAVSPNETYALYEVIGRLLCAGLIVVLPLLAWRGLESH